MKEQRWSSRSNPKKWYSLPNGGDIHPRGQMTLVLQKVFLFYYGRIAIDEKLIRKCQWQCKKLCFGMELFEGNHNKKITWDIYATVFWLSGNAVWTCMIGQTVPPREGSNRWLEKQKTERAGNCCMNNKECARLTLLAFFTSGWENHTALLKEKLWDPIGAIYNMAPGMYENSFSNVDGINDAVRQWWRHIRRRQSL